MKKIRISITAILVGLATIVMNSSVFAASYGVYLAGNDTFLDTIYLSLGVSGSASMGGACGGICGIEGVLSYDQSKIELISASGLQGFDFTQGAKIVLYKSTAAGDGGVLSLGFRNVGMAPGETTTVSVTGISVTNGDTEVGLGVTSKTIQYVQPQPAPQPPAPNDTPSPEPVNNTPASNPSQPSAQSTSTSEESNDTNEDEQKPDEHMKEEERPKSSNVSLKDLSLSVGGLKFSNDILSYDIIVDDDTEEITIEASPEDEHAHIEGIGVFPVEYGVNEYNITVIAEDGSKKDFTIKIYRDGADAAISKYKETTNRLTVALTAVSVTLAATIFAGGVYFVKILMKKPTFRAKFMKKSK